MNQPLRWGGWEAGGSLSHLPRREGSYRERGRSAVGKMQAGPQQGLSGLWLLSELILR